MLLPLLLLLLPTFGARADAPRTSSLSWVRLAGAEACVSTQALALRVETRVGRRVFVSASQADLSLEGHVERVAGAWVATLAVSDPAGHVLGRRVLRVAGERCEALTSSLVLVIAIGIDAEAALPPSSDGLADLSDETRTMLAQLELPRLSAAEVLELAVPDPRADAAARHAAAGGRAFEPQAGDAATHAAESGEQPRAPRASQPRLLLALHTGLAAQFGVLPDPSLGMALRITLHARPLWPVEFSATGLWPQTQAVGAVPGAGEFAFWAAGLAVCLPWGDSQPFGFRVCGGARAGMLHSRGRDFGESLSTNGPWVDATLHGGPRLQLGPRGPFWVDVLGSLSLPLIRDTFSYEDRAGKVRALHRAAWLGIGLEIGAGIFF